MRVFVPGTGRNDAAVRNFADRILELDGGVVNVEPAGQQVSNLAQDVFAF